MWGTPQTPLPKGLRIRFDGYNIQERRPNLQCLSPPVKLVTPSPPVKFSHWHFHWAWTSYLTRLTGRLDPRTPVLPVPLWSNLCCNSSEKVDFQRHLPHPIISLLQIKVSGQCIWLVKTESHACPELQERLGKWVTDFCFRDAGIIRRISFQS